HWRARTRDGGHVGHRVAASRDDRGILKCLARLGQSLQSGHRICKRPPRPVSGAPVNLLDDRGSVGGGELKADEEVEIPLGTLSWRGQQGIGGEALRDAEESVSSVWRASRPPRAGASPRVHHRGAYGS